MKQKLTADKGYARKKAAGDDGWGGKESAYDDLKGRIEMSLRQPYVPTHGRLLELGCGAGNLTFWLAAKGYECHGVDITPTAIAWAQEKNVVSPVKATFSVGDVTDLASFADGFFDFVLDGHCLHWLEGEDRRQTLLAVRRVLKEEGFLLVCSQCGEPTLIEKWKKEGMTWDPVRRVAINQAGCVGAYFGTPESIVAEVQSAGFVVMHWEVITDENGDDLFVRAIKPRG
jgi:SAM-dependent methyltransferase